MPEIDVLIPVYNAAATIRIAVLSICRQTFRDIRLLVVDDGSTDGTGAILQEMAAEDDRIEVITRPNGGIVDALNIGLARATAPFIARHDADDIAFPDRFARQLAFLRRQPDCVAIGCNAFHVDQSGARLAYLTEFREVVTGDPYYAPAIEPYLLHPFLLVRREALVTAGGYRYVFHSEDADLYWRLAGQGRLSNVVEPLGEYRIHDESVSGRSTLNGRISAVNSQLAALSERRRRAGIPDLVFERTALARYQEGKTLHAILSIGCEPLTDDEAGYLAIATAAKLLELVEYRPYRLEPDDLVTIRKSIERNFFRIGRVNRRQLVFRYLLRPKRRRSVREQLALVPWRIMPSALWELAMFVVSRRLGRDATSAA